jgi:hypothetical protein
MSQRLRVERRAMMSCRPEIPVLRWSIRSSSQAAITATQIVTGSNLPIASCLNRCILGYVASLMVWFNGLTLFVYMN